MITNNSLDVKHTTNIFVVFFIFHEQIDEVHRMATYDFENTPIIISQTTGKEQAYQSKNMI